MIHAQQLAANGGLNGVRDDGYLVSALARPRNLYAYEPDSPLERLAACYAFGISGNHPFNDGNKRTAFLTMYVFLRRNGLVFSAAESDVVTTFVALAAGDLSEDALTDWIQRNTKPSG
jgi:death-on-curing protein